MKDYLFGFTQSRFETFFMMMAAIGLSRSEWAIAFGLAIVGIIIQVIAEKIK